jgi:hypothetical protein
MPEPEIISPSRQPVRGLSDEQLDHLAAVLDDIFHIPGTKLRFGLDPIIGLVPGLGDVISAILSFLFVFAAWRRGLPRITIFRMVANIAIDTLIGAIPILGDMFDAAWKSNRMNYNLLVRYRGGVERRHVARDWLFLLLLLLCAAALVIFPILFVIWLYHLLIR